MDYDKALSELKALQTDFGEFVRKHGKANEEDTRELLITRMLERVLG